MGAICKYPDDRRVHEPVSGTLSAQHPPFRVYIHYPENSNEILALFLFDSNTKDDPYSWRSRFMQEKYLVHTTTSLQDAHDTLNFHREMLRK